MLPALRAGPALAPLFGGRTPVPALGSPDRLGSREDAVCLLRLRCVEGCLSGEAQNEQARFS